MLCKAAFNWGSPIVSHIIRGFPSSHTSSSCCKLTFLTEMKFDESGGDGGFVHVD